MVNEEWSEPEIVFEDGVSPSDFSFIIDDDNMFHITFIHEYDGLKYLTDKSGEWVTRTLDEDGGSTGVQLVEDDNGQLHVVYFSKDLSTLWHGSFDPDQVEEYSKEKIDDQAHGDARYHSARLVVDENAKAHVVYIAGTTEPYDLNYATNASGAWEIETVFHDSGER